MIRFIDLRDQILDVEDTPVHFAFFDTVHDRFLSLSGSQEWQRRADFIDDYAADDRSDEDSGAKVGPLDRFLRLMPEWVP